MPEREKFKSSPVNLLLSYQVPSQSRPGAFSYLNVNTGERVAERPTRPASAGGALPPGWKKVPSQSRPGEFVYMNVNTGERIAWRPTGADGSRPGQQVVCGANKLNL